MAISGAPVPNPHIIPGEQEITSLEQIQDSFNVVLNKPWIKTEALKADGLNFNIRERSNFKFLDRIKSFKLREKRLGENDTVLEFTAEIDDGSSRDLDDILVDPEFLFSGRYIIKETQTPDEEGQLIYKKEIISRKTEESAEATIFSVTYPSPTDN